MSEQIAGRFQRRKISTCINGCITFSYELPVRLDESILPFLEPLGKLELPFEKTSVLKLTCSGFTVTGIKRLKELRLILQKGMIETDLLPFETVLDAWLTQIAGAPIQK